MNKKNVIKKLEEILDNAVGHWHRIVFASDPDSDNGWTGDRKCIYAVQSALGELTRMESLNAIRRENAETKKGFGKIDLIFAGLKKDEETEVEA